MTVEKILNPVCGVTNSVNWVKRPRGSVFIQGDFAKKSTEKLLTNYGFTLADSIEECDVLCLLGGADINPALYGERMSGTSGFSQIKDAEDLNAIKKAGNRFKLGICRGAQLLNCIPNGGSLWQDVNHHGYGEHLVTDVITGCKFNVNSLHHQQIRLTDKAELVAWTDVSTFKTGGQGPWYSDTGKPDKDVEAAYYPDTRSLLIQWHPELGQDGDDSIEYFYDLLERYYDAA